MEYQRHGTGMEDMNAAERSEAGAVFASIYDAGRKLISFVSKTATLFRSSRGYGYQRKSYFIQEL